MGYTPGKGIGRAKLLAIQSLIQANIGSLNDALNANPETSFLTGTGKGGAIKSQHVIIGKTRQNWVPLASDNKGGPIRICVCNTDYASAISFTSVPFAMEVQGVSFQYSFNTSVFVYVHPDSIRFQNNPELAVYSEEMVLTCIEDWFRAYLFAPFQNQKLALDSNEFNNSPDDHDTLVEVYCTQGTQGYFETSFENATFCAGLHLIIGGKVY